MTRKVLVDTSAWVDHLKGATDLVANAGQKIEVELVAHPMVLVELLLGGMPKDAEAMKHLKQLRILRTVNDAELTAFIDKRGIQGAGIGYVDANLLASCVLDDAELLSFDRKLNDCAMAIGLTVYQKVYTMAIR